MNERPVIAVVTDSAAGLPPELIQSYSIEVIPFWVRLGGDTYQDGVEIQPDELFQRLRRQAEPDASTSVPSVAAFFETYERLAQWAEGIVSIHVAGRQSGTCNTAKLAGRECSVPVRVVDTGTTAMGEGFVVLEAARTALSGATLDDVVARALSVVENAGLIALLESVDYAVRGGRLSSAARAVGSLLNIQPLVRVKGNKVGLMGQVRRRSKGLRQLLDKLAAEIGDFPSHVTVHYTEDRAEGSSLLEEIRDRFNCVESYLTYAPAALGIHAGPGAVGVAYYVERESSGLAQQIEKLTGYARDALGLREAGGDED